MSNSRLYRGSKSSTTTDVEVCRKNSTDCMYLNSNGTCSAEWCIYEELPKIISTGRELTCSICGKNKKTVSIYSGITSYICEECQQKLKLITPDKKHCALCSTEISLDQVICTDCQKKLVDIIEEKTCPICGTPIDINQSICSSCAQKIKEKINE